MTIFSSVSYFTVIRCLRNVFYLTSQLFKIVDKGRALTRGQHVLTMRHSKRNHEHSRTKGANVKSTPFLQEVIKDQTILYIRFFLINNLTEKPCKTDQANSSGHRWLCGIRKRSKYLKVSSDVYGVTCVQCYKRSISPLDLIKRYLAFIPNIDFRMRADIAIYVNLVENKNGTSSVKKV